MTTPEPQEARRDLLTPHPFDGEDGHNCSGCRAGSIWGCDEEAHRELTDPEFSGTVRDPILLVLQRHQWVRWNPGPLGFCICDIPGWLTPHAFRQHVRQFVLEALDDH